MNIKIEREVLQQEGFEFDGDTGFPKVSIHDNFKLSSKLARVYLKYKIIQPADVVLYDEIADLYRLSHKEAIHYHHTATFEVFCYYTSNTAQEYLGYTRTQYTASMKRLENAGLIKSIGNGDKNATMYSLPFEQTIKAKRGEEFCGIRIPSDIILPAGDLNRLIEFLNTFSDTPIIVPNHNEELERVAQCMVKEKVKVELQEIVLKRLKIKLESISRPIRMKESYATALIKDVMKELPQEKKPSLNLSLKVSPQNYSPQPDRLEKNPIFNSSKEHTQEDTYQDLLSSFGINSYLLSEEEARNLPF
ncbi:hypothetical protein [Bacillus massiliigorillae]|uniref:hypothetical protein n=1 Tax=Bacillus massiliigorillae TaxID=1243664 RepID=UPI00039E85AD|nr:hypothetical protein [Bacillus massiliigorillae]